MNLRRVRGRAQLALADGSLDAYRHGRCAGRGEVLGHGSDETETGADERDGYAAMHSALRHGECYITAWHLASLPRIYAS